MEKIELINKKKLIKFIVIPVILLLVWLVLTVAYIIKIDSSLTVLSYIHGKENFNLLTDNKLLKGDKISGTFTAEENNLGIVSIRFRTFIRPAYKDEDVLVFRIKERGLKQWYYQNKYRDGSIYDVSFFPFGFPKIADSKGKTYYFEVESLNGDQNNSVALSNIDQAFFSKYQIPKSMIIRNEKELMIFAFKKLVNSMWVTDIRFSSFIYLLPFIFYLFWILPIVQNYKMMIVNTIIEIIKRKFYFIILGAVLLDILIIQLFNDVVYLIISLLWLVVLHISKKKSRLTFIVSLFIFIIAPITLSYKDGQTAGKASAWAFVFLVSGIIQLFIELKRDGKKRLPV